MKYVYATLTLALLLAGLVFYRTSLAPENGERVLTPRASLGEMSFTLEVASTSEARQRGLSGRPYVPEDYGMLFVFKEEDRYGFWMKDTLVPLDIFWLDSKGHVLHVEPDVATSTYPHVFYPPVPARYVLETAAGFARAYEVVPGTRFELQNVPIVSE